MAFAGKVFVGRVSYSAVWYSDPATGQILPEPHQVAARWCGRCWKLIADGRAAYVYGGNGVEMNLCKRCHRRVNLLPPLGRPKASAHAHPC